MALDRYVVNVTDEDGAIIFTDVVVLARDTENKYSPAERALLISAPETCPWDCDNCRDDDEY